VKTISVDRSLWSRLGKVGSLDRRYSDVIRLLAACQPKSRKIAGLGKFSSGVPDLGSRKKHLQDFGR